jgi:hypothetical protein
VNSQSALSSSICRPLSKPLRQTRFTTQSNAQLEIDRG